MSEQVIRIMCPNLACRRVLAVPPEARGKIVRCRNCSTNVRVPAPTIAPSPATPSENTQEDAA